VPTPTKEDINEEFEGLPINLMVYHIENVEDALSEPGSFEVRACIIPDPLEDDPYDDVDEDELSCVIVFPPQVTPKGVADALLTVLKCPHSTPLAESNGCTKCMSTGKAVIRKK
jgi:hypothetical protein